MSEKEKYLARLEEKKKNGLIHVNLTANPDADWSIVDEEELYAELNRMDEAPSLPDYELWDTAKFVEGRGYVFNGK